MGRLGMPRGRRAGAVVAVALGVMAVAVALPLWLVPAGRSPAWHAPAGPVAASFAAAFKDPVRPVGMALHGTTLAAGSAGLAIDVWDIRTGRVTAALTSPEVMLSAAFSPDGKTLATGDLNGHVYLWDIAAGKITATLTEPIDPAFHDYPAIVSVAFAPDGKTLATGDILGRGYLWDAGSGKITATRAYPGGRRAQAAAAAFGPDGTLAIGYASARAYLWDATGKVVAALTDPRPIGGHLSGPTFIIAVQFSPDGKTLAMADSNNAIYLWRIAR